MENEQKMEHSDTVGAILASKRYEDCDRGCDRDRDGLEIVTAQGVSDARSDIRDAAFNSGVTHHLIRLADKVCDSEKEAIKANYEARLESKDLRFELNKKIDSEAERTREEIRRSERTLLNEIRREIDLATPEPA